VLGRHIAKNLGIYQRLSRQPLIPMKWFGRLNRSNPMHIKGKKCVLNAPDKKKKKRKKKPAKNKKRGY